MPVGFNRGTVTFRSLEESGFGGVGIKFAVDHGAEGSLVEPGSGDIGY